MPAGRDIPGPFVGWLRRCHDRLPGAALALGALLVAPLAGPGAGSGGLHAQATSAADAGVESGDRPAAYRASGTQWFQAVNPFRLYWLRDADTVGIPLSAVTVERFDWSDPAPGTGDLELRIRQHSLTVQRAVEEGTLTVSPRGEVREIRDWTGKGNGPWDLLLRLPAAPIPLTRGARWQDTLDQRWAGAHGEDHFTVTRTLHVARVVDSLGTRVAEVRSTGRVAYRTTDILDSAAGTWVHADVAGPTTETYYFDVDNGLLLGREWVMALQGRGALPDGAGGMDSLPAGLNSRYTMRALDPDRAALLVRELPPGDTSITIAPIGTTPTVILLHTANRNGPDVEAGTVGNDGLVGTVTARYKAGTPIRVAATYTRPDEDTREVLIQAAADGYTLNGGPLAIPGDAAVWGVADHAIYDPLVPTLLALKPGLPVDLGVYRPYDGVWDLATAVVQPLADVHIAIIEWESGGPTLYLLYDTAGDLLYAETEDATYTRVASPGTPRYQRVERILNMLNQDG